MGASPFARGGAAGGTVATTPAPAQPRPNVPAANSGPASATAPGGARPAGAGQGDPFSASAPRGISGMKIQHLINQLVVVHPTEHGLMKTVNPDKDREDGKSEFVRVDCYALTAPDGSDENPWFVINTKGKREDIDPYEPGHFFSNMMVFNKALVREFTDAMNNGTGWLVGRVSFGEERNGNNAPYILVEGDEEDWALYNQWAIEEKARRAAAKTK